MRKMNQSITDREQTEWFRGRRQGVGKIGEGFQNIQTSRYKISKLQGCSIQHGDSTVYLKVAKRVDPKCSYQEKKKQ